MTLNEVKVGDLVLYYARHNWSLAWLKKVKRVTKSQIILDNNRAESYWKKNGREVGQSGERDWAYIEIPTAEQIAEIRERDKRHKIIIAIEECEFSKLSTARLEQILALCKEVETANV